MHPKLAEIQEKAELQIPLIVTRKDLEEFRIHFLGKKSALTSVMELLKTAPPEEKRQLGTELNQIKKWLETVIAEKQSQVKDEQPKKTLYDRTLPPILPARGRLHPITQTIQEITFIFQRFGFEVANGPEIETEFHNFTALNIPLDHASRDGFDTFYAEDGRLLRSQTSTVQIRVMQKRKPPLRIISPGRVYRPDTVDATHSFMFHQIEGLLVDEKVSFSDLKGLLLMFLRELFGKDTKVRFRPHFFPFTEPSVEVDILWKKGWLEILGAGSVDPNVFEAVNYDPKKVQGLAFGLGVERIAMLRHGISDIRAFYDNDIRFLRQFS